MTNQFRTFIAIILLLSLILVGSVSAGSLPGIAQELEADTRVVAVVRSACWFGLYTDDAGHGLGNLDTYLYLSNLDLQVRNFDVFVSFIDATGVPQLTPRSFVLAPNELRFLTCADLAACDTNGWLYIQSDAAFIGATVLIAQPQIPGALTAQAPTGCIFNQ